jgi:sortase A
MNTMSTETPSSALRAPSPAKRRGRRLTVSAFSRFFQREKVAEGRMRDCKPSSILNLLNFLAILCIIGAVTLLGKSCWITLKAEVAQVLLHRAFTQSMASGENIKPWSWADTWPVAEVRIPRIGAEAIVLNGATSEALAFGPTWLPDTPKPGEPGTAVIAAHRDTHFAFLKDVAINDQIQLTRTDGLTFQYKVTNMRVAKWNTSGIDRHARGHHLVLTTCYPFDAVTRGNQRYIVEAELVN